MGAVQAPRGPRATVAQFAAPQGAAGSRLNPRGHTLRGTSQGLMEVAREVSTGSPWAPTPLDVPGAHESGDSCALRSPQAQYDPRAPPGVCGGGLPALKGGGVPWM